MHRNVPEGSTSVDVVELAEKTSSTSQEESLKATISQLVMENDVLKASLQDSRGLRDSLETEVKSLIEQREESQRRNKDLSHRLDSSEQLKNDTMNQMARLTVQNSRERDEAASLIANLSQKLNAADLAIFESQTQLNSAKKSTEISDATHAEMAQRITSLTEEIILRREESSAAVQERESLRERLRQVTDQLMEADSLKMEFEIQMADGEKQRTQLISQVEELRKSLSEGQEVVKKESGQHTNTLLTAAVDQIQLSTDQLATLKVDCEERNTDVRDAQHRVDDFTEENDNLNLEVEKLIARLAVAHREKSELEQRLKQLVLDQNNHVAEQEGLLTDARSSQAHFEMRVKDLVTQNAEMISRLVGSNEKTYLVEKKLSEALGRISNVEKEREDFRSQTLTLSRKLTELSVSEADLRKRSCRISQKIHAGMQTVQMVSDSQSPDMKREVLDEKWKTGSCSFGKVQSLVSQMGKGGLDSQQKSPVKRTSSTTTVSSTSSRPVFPASGHCGKPSLTSLTVKKSNKFASIALNSTMGSLDNCTDGGGSDVIQQYQDQVSAEKKKRKELEYQLSVMSQTCKMAADINQQWQEAFLVLDRTYEWKSDQPQPTLVEEQFKKRHKLSRSRSFQGGHEVDVLKDDKPTQTEFFLPRSKTFTTEMDRSLHRKVADVYDSLSRLRAANQDLRRLVAKQTSSADVFRLLWVAVSEASEDYKKMQRNLEDMIHFIGNQPSGVDKKPLVAKRVIRDKEGAVPNLRMSAEEKFGSDGAGATYLTPYQQSSQERRTVRRSAPISSATRTRV